MKFILDTHKGLVIENPKIEILGTFDNLKNETFQPSVLLIGENFQIHHDLPEFPYINGTWNDEDVEIVVSEYFQNLNQELI